MVVDRGSLQPMTYYTDDSRFMRRVIAFPQPRTVNALDVAELIELAYNHITQPYGFSSQHHKPHLIHQQTDLDTELNHTVL